MSDQEPVNMYDEQQPIATRGGVQLMQIAKSGAGWTAQIRICGAPYTYVSEDGWEWFCMSDGELAERGSKVDMLLCERVRYLAAMRAVGR
jgi:hypothetical protein